MQVSAFFIYSEYSLLSRFKFLKNILNCYDQMEDSVYEWVPVRASVWWSKEHSLVLFQYELTQGLLLKINRNIIETIASSVPELTQRLLLNINKDINEKYSFIYSGPELTRRLLLNINKDMNEEHSLTYSGTRQHENCLYKWETRPHLFQNGSMVIVLISNKGYKDWVLFSYRLISYWRGNLVKG